MPTLRWLLCLSPLLVLLGACAAPVPPGDASVHDGSGMDSESSADTGPIDSGVCVDLDNDGHPAATCGGDDCDDNNPRIHPGIREVCDNNGVDEDCDPCTVAEVTVSGRGGDGDRDEDEFPSAQCFNRVAAGASVRCDSAAPIADAGLDPDAGEASSTLSVNRVIVSATEVRGTDCADDPAAGGGTRFPGANEICNGLDDDCDAMRDEGLELTFYRDRDGDGFGDRNAMGTDVLRGCSAPMGYALSTGDCNDTIASISPAAREVCDSASSVDENCNGVAEEDCGCLRVGDTRACCSNQGVETCSLAGMGSVWSACSARPTGVEVCDGRDNDCNELVDEGLTIRCYPDGDNDGFAAVGATLRAVCPDEARVARGRCPANFTNVTPAERTTDCNDSSAAQAPGLAELCDTIDNDCNPSTVDGSSDARVGTMCAGSGGVGRCATGTNVCGAGGISCQRNTAVMEMCNGVDDDCDGSTDEPTCVHGSINGRGEQELTGYGVCTGGNLCQIATCVLGRQNCDGDSRNGCESVAATDPNNCGGCGVRCLGGSSCVNGLCTDSRAAGISAGDQATCARSASGRSYCWGLNNSGQVGDGTLISRPAPTWVTGLTDAAQIATRGGSSCAVRRNGEVLCWGSNNVGQLGDGTSVSRPTPAPVTGLTDAVEIAVGVSHACARRSNGTVVCWGNNARGQLGDGTTTARWLPVAVLRITTAVEITAGAQHTCARLANNTVQCWGDNSFSQLSSGGPMSPMPIEVRAPPEAVEVDAGYNHTCFRTIANTVRCWGDNAAGQLGIGSTTRRDSPTLVVGLFDALELSAGAEHTCARRAGGVVSCWGQNNSAQLGNNSSVSTTTPVAVANLTGATMISAGASHTCARAAFDQIVCWGNNRNGSLGDDTLVRRQTPVTVVGNTGGAELTAGKSFTCARRNTGEVLCWGGNSSGQLGDGSTATRSAPTRVLNITDATQIDAGPDHICARRANGSVLCWGSNSMGQLGDMTTINRSTPVAVTGLTDAVLLTAGGEHTCALRATGAVVCWGKNESGQLGIDRVTRSSWTPVTPTGAALVDVQSLSAGDDHTCARLALTLSGRPPILCWGSNRAGQLGDGTRATDRHTPAAAINLADGVDVVASNIFTCARRSNSTTACWGSGASGRIGNGGADEQLSATTVTSLSDALELSLGGEFACARRATGAVSCWGSNDSRQLGAGDLMPLPSRATPADVMNLSGVLQIGAGGAHVCARRATREVVCWGNNNSFQLGTLAAGNSAMPLVVNGL